MWKWAPIGHMPDAVTFEQAASLPIAYGTAYRMMITRGRLQAGELVLILGASGGVGIGIGCVQIARNLKARVIACASSAEKLRRLKELGADHVIDYTKEDFSKRAWEISGKRGVDVDPRGPRSPPGRGRGRQHPAHHRPRVSVGRLRRGHAPAPGPRGLRQGHYYPLTRPR